MGAAASSSASAEVDVAAPRSFVPVVVEVRSASGLRKADWAFGSGGKSDPYVVVRVGPVGTSWAQKAEGVEWRSLTFEDAKDVAFGLLFSFNGAAPWSYFAGAKELHCRVFDEDVLSRDDFLGEAIVALPAAGDALETALPLAGSPEAQGTLAVAAWTGGGERAAPPWAAAVAGEAAVVKGTRRDALDSRQGWEAISGALAGWFGVGDDDAEAAAASEAPSASPPLRYFTDMILLKLKPYSDVFYARSEDGGVTAAFPGPGATSYLTHADVSSKLAAVPARQKRGEIWRSNPDSYLGFLRLPDKWWTEVEPRGIALGCTVKQHRWLRPILDDMVGPDAGWTTAALRKDADAFLDLKKATGLKVQNDIKVFGQLALHRQMFGREISIEDAQEITDQQTKLTLMSTLPKQVLDVDFIAGKLGLPSALKFRTKWLATYRAWLKESKYVREPWSLDDDQVDYAASAALDAVLFAGGLSVASVISCSLAVAYAGAQSPLAMTPETRTPQIVPQLVWEVIRYFPAVVGFPWYEDDTLRQRTILALAMALRDPRVWGKRAETFELRPLGDYHRLSVAFADQAVDTEDGTMSRVCPAKDFALAFCYEFVRAVFAGPWTCADADKITFEGSTPFVSDFALTHP